MKFFEKMRHKFITDFVNENKYINRIDICNEFGISIPQASNDLAKWMAQNPDKIEYNVRSKRYEAVE